MILINEYELTNETISRIGNDLGIKLDKEIENIETYNNYISKIINILRVK